MSLTSALLLLSWCQSADSVGSGPAPSAVPISWELKFDFLDLRRITVEIPGAPAETYWYLVYTATNTSDRSQHFFPIFDLVTDDLKVHTSDTGISPLVFDAIKQRHRLTHPQLLHPTQAIGALQSGQDNARESVAIWRQFDLNVNTIRVFVAGLSGEKRFVRNPGYDPAAPEGPGNPRNFTLRKTLQIVYNLPGSPVTRERGEPQRVAVRWVMR